ncbi:P-loop containing nucleoside triphosphate hydrolase protein [Hesseltinella vesiculosa]|uniref:RNA helicase n=1 Tax=Hesseltinella vesiculosa TaxID=101127 RepID=A0A1X2G4F7_9FUNG|nr:P-loop containing nucleoside triphosphate hydrolase protein [Hesseltinella vesiculosa]
MAYATKDGKDTVVFVDKDYIANQKEESVPKQQDNDQDQDPSAAAYDPETGEINWDCPCLGGMAQGPCGEQFKAAFSCFVYSEAEPKGVDCVEKFKAMQDCFREHPDVYGDELDDDEDDEKPEAKDDQPKEDEPVTAASPAEDEPSTVTSWISSKKNKSKPSTASNVGRPNSKKSAGKDVASSDGSNDNKKSIFGDWTGKTPVTLLHEHAQKNEWEKPVIDMVHNKQGFLGSVRLSKRNKKTAQMQVVTFAPPPEISQPTSMEARHAAATYALHRVNSHMPMYRILPPQYRDYWRQFDEWKTPSNGWQYAPDPFTAQPPAPVPKSKRDRSLPSKEHANATIPLPPSAIASVLDDAMRQYWASLPTIHMTLENRDMVEKVIRQSATIYEPVKKPLPAQQSKKIVEQLVSMGFRTTHAKEALEYCSDVNTALDWLCLHVPEDDLPSQFLHASYNPKMTTIAHTSETLSRDWRIKRMMGFGYPMSACETAMTSNDDKDDLALLWLQQQLMHGLDNDDEIELDPESWMDEETRSMVVDEETMTLQSIYDTSFIDTKDEDGRRHFKIHIPVHLDAKHPQHPLILDIMFASSTSSTMPMYPDAAPIILIDCEGLPSYLKLAMTQGLVQETRQHVGMPMVYMCVEWLQDHASTMIAHPPKLRKVTDGMLMIHQHLRDNVSHHDKKKKKKHHHHQPQQDGKTEALAAQLIQALANLHTSDAYAPFATVRSRLPAATFQEKVVQAVLANQVTIVSGETGCGKTTQVPQYILDQQINSSRGPHCQIICTQPRKISAIGVAERVAAERCEIIGETIGYAIRGETKVSKQTRLQFVTTGVLLRRLQSDPMLQGISHVMVDEVHERSVDSDFLLVLLRQLMEKRKDIKIILMSATINQKLFSDYFGGSPCLTIPGFTHPVQDFYLEDALHMVTTGGPLVKGNKLVAQQDDQNAWAEWQVPYLEQGYHAKAVHWLAKYRNQDKIDYDLVAKTVDYIVSSDQDHVLDDGTRPGVLIFMPGAMEIKKCVETIQQQVPGAGLEVVPLHANLSPQEQARVFKRVPAGTRKVVVATNVAETSITIEGIVYVIDSGRVKETQYDAQSNMMHLVETWASRASCKQRRGRAGRTRPGQCFKLFSRSTEQDKMASQQTPELLRTPLEQLCLQVKAMGEGDVVQFLRQAIDPPSMAALETAVRTLKAVDALDTQDQLTPLGMHMASIPADLRISKMLLLGSIFKCLDPILTIAATMSMKSPFVSPMDKREEARKAREQFFFGRSDWLTDQRAFDAWHRVIKENGMRAARKFCETNYVSFATMTEIQALKRQYADALQDIGFYNRSNADHYNANVDQINLLKAIVFSGLNPHLARIKTPETKYDKIISGTVERKKEAREFKYYTKDDGRVFLHPSSILFNHNQYDAAYLTYFSRMATSKTFLRDGTEVPNYGLLFFGGQVQVDHRGRGLVIGEDGYVKFRAWSRVGVLVNQLKRLFSVELDAKIKQPDLDVSSSGVVRAMVELLSKDGL